MISAEYQLGSCEWALWLATVGSRDVVLPPFPIFFQAHLAIRQAGGNSEA